MAVSLSTIAAKDGAGTTISGGLQALDNSGGGTGPWTLGHIIIDGAAGTNIATVKAASTAPVAGDPALVVSISPNSVNSNGQKTMANSAPVVIASDQSALSVTIAANSSVNLTQIAGTSIVNGGLAGSQSVGGTVATGVAISANPLNLGVQAVSSENAAVTTGRQVQLVGDLVGKLITLPYANPENFVSGAITSSMTSTTSTSLLAAPASGLRNYITQITCSNNSATTGTEIVIQDGSGGTTLYTIPAAISFGGAAITFPVPLRQPTTATAIYCANVTTGSSTKVSASGYKGA